MKEDFVSREVAKLLRDEGYNEPCFMVYSTAGVLEHCDFIGKQYRTVTNSVIEFVVGKQNSLPLAAPTVLAVVRWLARNHRIFLDTNMVVTTAGEIKYDYTIYEGEMMVENTLTKLFENREAAYDAAIQHILKDLL